MKIIEGKKIADNILAELKKEIELKKTKLCLAIILIGNNPASLLYIKAKEKAAALVGIKVEKFLLPKESSESQILKVIEELNKNSNIDGILVQLPLPKGISPDRIIKEINPKKDVDGLLSDSGFDSPFILSIWEALKATKENLKDKKILALVNSEVFGKRLSVFFKQRELDLIWNENPLEAGNNLQKADVLITALGKPEIINASAIKEGAILIDGGISRVNNRIVGDIDAESVKQKAKWLSPVLGGLGPMTVAFLLKNLIKTLS